MKDLPERKHNKSILHNAQTLRKNMTKEEKRLWYDYLRIYPVKFLLQKILGKYIVDFYCAKVKLVIELDGSQHYEQVAMIKDDERSLYLENFGIKVIRIANNQITQNFEGVCTYIDNVVKQLILSDSLDDKDTK